LKKYLLLVVVIAVAFFLSRRFIFVTEADRIRRVVNHARRALEQEQSDALMHLLASDFQDHYGNDRGAIKSDIDNFFSQVDSIEVMMKIGSVRINNLDRHWVWNDSSGRDVGSHIDVVAPGALCSLRVRIFGKVEGEKGIVLGGIRPADVVLELVKNGTEWEVSYAQY